MASSYSESLALTSQRIITYMGMTSVVLGTLGGVLNIIVFLSLKTFRESSSAFYLTVMSFFNVGHLINGQLSRVLITGFGISMTQTSLFYCKFRPFGIQLFSYTSFTCMCLATIDQFLATSARANWQHWSTVKLAKYSCAMTIVVWAIYCTPYLIFYGHTISAEPGGVECSMNRASFHWYHFYINNFAIESVLFIAVSVLFGCLALRNVRHIAFRTVPVVRRELDKQLTKMVLVQLAVYVFTVAPYAVMNTIANMITTRNGSDDSARIDLAVIVTACLYYIYFAVSNNERVTLSTDCCLEFILRIYRCFGAIPPSTGPCPCHASSSRVLETRTSCQSNSSEQQINKRRMNTFLIHTNYSTFFSKN